MILGIATMENIIIRPGLNGERILKHLEEKKRILEEKLKLRIEEIREIGWDASA